MAKHFPLVSVIVPCHNGERFLTETLDSIFAQTYPNTEIILVDDGSSDNTPKIIKSIKEDVRSFFLPNNIGGGKARQKGFQVSKGSYIQYVDQDDILFPDAIEKRVEILENSECDIAYSDFQHITENDKGIFEPATIRNRKIDDSGPDIQLSLLNSWWAPPVSLTYRRTIAQKLSWVNCLVDDARYLFDACIAGARFIHSPGVMAYYRIHKHGTSRDQLTWYRDVLNRACYIESFWRGKNALSEQRVAALHSYYKDIVEYAKNKDPRLFNDAFERLLLLRPRNAVMMALCRIVGYRNINRIIKILSKIPRST